VIELSAAAALCSPAADSAREGSPPFYFRLDTGGHNDEVQQIYDVSRAGRRWLVSVSLDKTIRVWNLDGARTGDALTLASVHRYSCTVGQDGSFFKAALRPDQMELALAELKDGLDADIIVVDPVLGGRVKARVHFDDKIQALAYSPDGRFLAASHGKDGGTEVDVIDAQSHAVVRRLKLAEAWVYDDKGNKQELRDTDRCFALAWEKDGGLALGLTGGVVAYYDNSDSSYKFRGWEDYHGPDFGCGNIRAMAVSSQGDLAFSDEAGRVLVRSGSKVSRLSSLNDRYVTGLAFSSDGSQLAASFYLNDLVKEKRFQDGVMVWKRTGGVFIEQQVPAKCADAGDLVTTVAYLQSNHTVFGDVAGRIYEWDPAGNRKAKLASGHGIDAKELAWSKDGSLLQWKDTDDRVRWWNFATMTLRTPNAVPAMSKRSRDITYRLVASGSGKTKAGVLPQAGTVELRLNGGSVNTGESPAQFPPDEPELYDLGPNNTILKRCIVSPDSSYGVKQYDPKKPYDASDPDSQVVRKFDTGVSPVSDVAVDPSRTHLAAACSDHVIRIWSLAANGDKGAEAILCIYVGDDSEWVAWNEACRYYWNSVNGDAVVNWQVNEDLDAEARPFRAEDFKALHQEKKLVDIFRLGKAPALATDEANITNCILFAPQITEVDLDHVAGVNKNPNTGEDRAGQPDFLTDKRELTFDPSKVVTIKYGSESAPPATVDCQVAPGSADSRAFAAVIHHPGQGDKTYKIGPGKWKFTFIATNGKGESRSQPILVKCILPGPPEPTRGKLWVVAFGVDKYGDGSRRDLNLQYAAEDAKAIAEAFDPTLNQALYTGVEPQKPLLNEEATKDNIVRQLTDLKGRVAREDTLVVFFAGHGSPNTKGDDYLFLPSDFKPNDMDKTGLSWSTIIEHLKEIDAEKCVLFADCCFSGGAGENKLDQAKLSETVKQAGKQSNILALFSCQDNQVSYEDDKWQHGAFTKALLDALHGQNRPAGKTERLSDIFGYVIETVPGMVRRDKNDPSLDQFPSPRALNGDEGPEYTAFVAVRPSASTAPAGARGFQSQARRLTSYRRHSVRHRSQS